MPRTTDHDNSALIVSGAMKTKLINDLIKRRKLPLRVFVVVSLTIAGIVWSQVENVPSFASHGSDVCSPIANSKIPKTVAKGSTGNWVGIYGKVGYALAAWNGCSGTASGNDLIRLPSNIKMGIVFQEGGRYTWANPTTDARALQSPNQKPRQAGVWFAAGKMVITLSFLHSFTGDITIYAVDWNSAGRRESITVSDSSRADTVELKSFAKGVWSSFPVKVAARGKVMIKITNDTPGLTAQLSGIYLD